LLHEQLAQIMASLSGFPVEKQVDFTEDPAENAKLWAIRKDTFPAVGAVRKTGTTVIIEDVTFPVEQLAIGVNRLIELFDKHPTMKRSFSDTRWKAICTSSSPKASTTRKKSHAIKRSWTTSRNWSRWSSAVR
jgi:FAD/FMN-containing dehydrogenase